MMNLSDSRSACSYLHLLPCWAQSITKRCLKSLEKTVKSLNSESLLPNQFDHISIGIESPSYSVDGRIGRFSSCQAWKITPPNHISTSYMMLNLMLYLAPPIYIYITI